LIHQRPASAAPSVILHCLAIVAMVVCCSCSKPRASVAPVPQPVVSTNPAESTPFFVEVGPEAGLTAVLYCGGANKDHILESVGSGAAFVDYDEDGLLDLYLVNAWQLDESPSQIRSRGRNVLYRNLGNGRFEDVTQRAGVGDESWGCGVCAGDYDNDGHVDLFVTNFGPDRLYRNVGSGTFEEVSETAGVADDGWGAGASFFDADRDGDLDLYVANYIDCKFEDVLRAQRTHVWQGKVKVMAGPFGLRGGRDRFYRNNGNGTFTEATDEVGMTDVAESYGLGVLASDLDQDGDVDVFVANDSNPNFLYRNDGRGKFAEVGSWTGAAVNAEGAAQGSMGVDAGDFDGDGFDELYVTTFARDNSTLFHNHGGLLFEDVSAKHPLKRFTFMQMSWGCAFFDYDLDGDLDLAEVNGHIYPQVDEYPDLGESYRQEPLLLENIDRRFNDVSRQAFGAKKIAVSGRGLAIADYDNDGDLDFVMTAIDSPAMLFRNETPRKGHWLKLRLINDHGSPAIGARAKITTAGVSQTRELRSGSSYQSQNALELHFGLGAKATIDLIHVHWPNGETSVQKDVNADQIVLIRQPLRRQD
jgi:hypothetical protein